MKVVDPDSVAGVQLLGDHVGIALVDGAVALPITMPYQRRTETAVEHRPQRAVREASIVTVDLPFGERNR
jgi:hypothetical protein